jgi:hypothetical protein
MGLPSKYWVLGLHANIRFGSKWLVSKNALAYRTNTVKRFLGQAPVFNVLKLYFISHFCAGKVSQSFVLGKRFNLSLASKVNS